MSSLQHALDLAAQGFHVFPVVPGGKLPAIGGWPERATNNPDAVRKLWTREDPVLGDTRELDYSVGIFTGRFQDDKALLVLDVDTKNGRPGKATFDNLDTLYGTQDWNRTRTVLTPSGGVHYYFVVDKPVATTASKLGDGVDTRSGGGFVVAPGMRNATGLYEVIDPAPVAPAPSWLVDMVGEPRVKPEGPKQAIELLDVDAAIARAVDYLQHAPPAIEGRNGDTDTFRVAAKIKDFGVTELTAVELMAQHWNPRCEPPWDYDALALKVANAYAYGDNPIGSSNPQADFANVDVAALTSTGTITAPPQRSKLFYEKADLIEPELNRRFLIDGWLDQGSMSVIYGESNVGKTFLTMDMAWHVANSLPWQGCDVAAGAVVYVAAEAGLSARRRVKALRIAKPGAGPAPFALVPCPVDLLHANADTKPLIKLVRDVAADFRLPVTLIVIDTLSRALAGGNENAPDDMGALVANLDQIRVLTGAHLAIVHHSGKDKARGARGHSLLRAATDTEIEIADGTAYATKQRDMEALRPVAFRLRGVELGRDGRGKPVTSAVVDTFEAGSVDALELTEMETFTLECLQIAIEKSGKVIDGQRVASRQEWLDIFVSRKNRAETSVKTENYPARLFRVHKAALVKKFAVEKVKGDQWAIA